MPAAAARGSRTLWLRGALWAAVLAAGLWALGLVAVAFPHYRPATPADDAARALLIYPGLLCVGCAYAARRLGYPPLLALTLAAYGLAAIGVGLDFGHPALRPLLLLLPLGVLSAGDAAWFAFIDETDGADRRVCVIAACLLVAAAAFAAPFVAH